MFVAFLRQEGLPSLMALFYSLMMSRPLEMARIFVFLLSMPLESRLVFTFFVPWFSLVEQAALLAPKMADYFLTGMKDERAGIYFDLVIGLIIFECRSALESLGSSVLRY